MQQSHMQLQLNPKHQRKVLCIICLLADRIGFDYVDNVQLSILCENLQNLPSFQNEITSPGSKSLINFISKECFRGKSV